MFTGIVEELGEIVGIDTLEDAARLVIKGPVVTSDAGHGDSIAVNGVCLTVVEVRADGAFTADVMAETLNRSSPSAIGVGSHVNLERAAAVNSRLGGHIVQGHVDGTGRVISPVAVAELGSGAHRAARRPVPVRGGEGLDHGRRHLADGVRARQRGERSDGEWQWGERSDGG